MVSAKDTEGQVIVDKRRTPWRLIHVTAVNGAKLSGRLLGEGATISGVTLKEACGSRNRDAVLGPFPRTGDSRRLPDLGLVSVHRADGKLPQGFIEVLVESDDNLALASDPGSP